MNMCILPDGYIFAAPGTFYSDGKNNDAATLTHDLQQDISGIKEFLQEGDVIVVDRGYRDCAPFLNELGLRVEMPRSLQRNSKQHSTEDANASRKVTITRWKVEARNGHIKTIFKFFAKTLYAGDVPYAGEYFQIACTIINAYRPVIPAANETEEVANQLIARRHRNNEVMDFVLNNNLISHRVSGWQLMEDIELEEFPRLTHDELIDLTLGEYQIRMAAGYNAEVEDAEGDREFHVARVNRTLLRACLRSRHVNSKQYYQFISFVPDGNGTEAIQGWYCTCVTGARTLGMCSHTCAILWYLCIDSYGPDMKRPKRRLLNIAMDAGVRD